MIEIVRIRRISASPYPYSSYALEFLNAYGEPEKELEEGGFIFSDKGAKELVDRFYQLGVKTSFATPVIAKNIELSPDPLVEALQSEIQHLRQIVDKLTSEQ